MRTAAAALVVWWAALAPLTGHAHPAVPTSAEATVEVDGRFRLAAHFDTLAFVLNDTSARIGNEPMEALLAGPRAELAAQLAEAKERFLHGFRVTTDQGPGGVEACEFPTADEVLAWKATTRTVLPVELPVRLSGRLPAGAGTVAFRFPSVLEQVILTVERPDEEPFAEQVETGASSSVLPLKLATAPAAVAPLAEAGKSRAGWRPTWPGGLGIALLVLGVGLLGGWLSVRRRSGPGGN